jgi:enterochelin esterase family protein
MGHAGTEDAGTAANLRYADEPHALAGVRLVDDIHLPAGRGDFVYDKRDAAWHLRLPPLPVLRLEYRLELRHPDGGTDVICDPGNPHRAPGAFGDKSVLELPGYRRPAWLSRHAAAAGMWRELTVPSTALRAELPLRIWSPEIADPAVPPHGILFAHDGGEYDRLAGIVQYSAAMMDSGRLPRHHLVLLSPVERNEWYAANPAYARALIDDVLPVVRTELGGGGPVVAVGASLGALALLHAHCRYPYPFDALFLQSGSFFQDRFDAQESSFPWYGRIVRFVDELRRDAAAPSPTVLTCGIAEENLANNRAMAAILREHDYPVRLVEVPDAHNFVAWRDAWHPHLADLAAQVWTADNAALRPGGT